MTELAPGIHRLKLPISMPDSTLAYVNAYLILGDEGYLLVDAGWNTDETFNTLKKQMAEIGADIKDISQIVITHVHPDHYGMAGRIKQLSGATLSFHEIEKGFIDSRYVNMDELLEQTAQNLASHGMPPREIADIRDATLGLEHYVVATYPDVALHGGETISASNYNFQVIWTPGHSSGHICLYEPAEKVLFAGDHILPTITPNVSLHPQSLDNPLGLYLDSLKKIRQMEIRLLLPGHEDPFTEPEQRIDQIIRHHDVRNREILTTLSDEARTAYQIVANLTWGVTYSWEEMPSFHRRLAIFETLSHLEMMVKTGHIDKTFRDGIIYYRQN